MGTRAEKEPTKRGQFTSKQTQQQDNDTRYPSQEDIKRMEEVRTKEQQRETEVICVPEVKNISLKSENMSKIPQKSDKSKVREFELLKESIEEANFYQTVGKWVRAKRGIQTLRDLASSMLNITHVCIQEVESGKYLPKEGKAKKLATALNIDPEVFLLKIENERLESEKKKIELLQKEIEDRQKSVAARLKQLSLL